LGSQKAFQFGSFFSFTKKTNIFIFLIKLYRNIAIYKYDMGITKSAVFTDEQNKLANLFKALGNPARLAIIAYLFKQESCVCGDIVDEIPLAQPTISQHLKELKAVGLIQGTVSGKSICYCVNPENIQLITKLLSEWEFVIKNTCCN
jgi:DNA-binding transcriptional ArsR family regulator